MLDVLFAVTFVLAGAVQGTVRAEGTLRSIAYATVDVIASDRRVVTNDRGVYVLAGLPAGEWALRVAALGYRPDTIRVRVPADGTVRADFVLEPQPVELAGIEVSAESESPEAGTAAGPPPVRVEGPSLALVPGVAEADIFRALQTLPAIAAASDFSSALYVRGGLPNQNLVTLDGAPLFNPYHLGGLFAAIDPSAVASVDVLPGAFPAPVGDRLSSAISIRTRDGGRDRVRGRGAVGLLSSRVSVDGPLFDGEGGFLFSLRRTYLDLFTDAAYYLGLIDFTVPYAFTDAHVKLTRDVGSGGSLSAVLYVDQEGVSLPERLSEDAGGDARFGWGTQVGSLEYRAPLSGTVFGELTLGWSRFGGSFHAWDEAYACPVGGTCGPTGERDVFIEAEMAVRDAIAAAELTWYRPGHEVRAGLQLDAYAVGYDIPIADADGFVPEFSRRSDLTTLAAFAEDAWRVSDAMRLRAGVRALAGDGRDMAWMPRIGARLVLSPRWSLSAGAGRYAQALYSLRNPESLTASLIAYDLLDVRPSDTGFSIADDATLGVSWTTPSTNIRADAYVKRINGLLVPPVPADVLNASPLAIEGRREGTGSARGVELYARHVRGRAEFTLAYTLGRAEWTVDGETYPPRFERRHMLNATAALPMGDDGVFSTRLALASGQPYTRPAGRIVPFWYDVGDEAFTDHYGRTRILVDEHNDARLPGYFRLDAAVRKSFDKRWFGADLTVTPYLQILNVLNTPNVLVGIPEGYGNRPELEFAPQLPILPTFGVEWRF